jgi:hypothetical protein
MCSCWHDQVDSLQPQQLPYIAMHNEAMVQMGHQETQGSHLSSLKSLRSCLAQLLARVMVGCGWG